ncbi:MAG: glycosyltransferase family 2 protein [Clostridia bacterium]|nr:glycosyltransferase family 2 protein [Clostridia bacterium]
MIEILLATYNGASYLKEQLDSIFAQTFQNFKVIARDDGSTDNTIEILEQYKQKFPEKLIYYKNEVPTGNAKDNFFLLMQDAAADFVCFCDQDDVWLPEKLEVTYRKMQTLDMSKPALVHTDLKVVDKDLNILHNSFFRMQHFHTVDKTPLNRILAQNVVTGCTVMINKPLLELAVSSNNNGIIMHDWWLGILASAFGSVSAVKQPTMLYRQHGSNSLGARSFWKSFRIFNDKKASGMALDRTFLQAGAFKDTFCDKLSNEIINPITEFSNIKSYPCKYKRLKIILKNRFLKQSVIRKLAQLIRI